MGGESEMGVKGDTQDSRIAAEVNQFCSHAHARGHGGLMGVWGKKGDDMPLGAGDGEALVHSPVADIICVPGEGGWGLGHIRRGCDSSEVICIWDLEISGVWVVLYEGVKWQGEITEPWGTPSIDAAVTRLWSLQSFKSASKSWA